MTGNWVRLIILGTALCFAADLVEAGNWVVITVQDVPEFVVAGKPVTLTYAVRQHGMTLREDLRDATIEARAGKNVVHAKASPTAESGFYSATLTLPCAGEWTVEIVSGFDGPFGDSLMTLRAVEWNQLAPYVSPEDRGKQLYAAKGCASCHVHEAVSSAGKYQFSELTETNLHPDYLRAMLAHPPQSEAFAPGRWQMPDLGLQEDEIEALVAFLTAEGKVQATVTATD